MPVIEEAILAQVELPYPKTSGNHHVRHSSGRHFLTKDAIAYRWEVAAKVGRRANPLAGPLHIDWLVAPPDRRARDMTNLHKVVEDALVRAGFIADDSNKVIVSGSWKWTEPLPGGAILVTAKRVV